MGKAVRSYLPILLVVFSLIFCLYDRKKWNKSQMCEREMCVTADKT